MPRARRTGQVGHILDLPPPFRLVVLREVGDAFAHACAHAAELGAGTLVFVSRFDAAEFAVVLEPEEPLASARRASATRSRPAHRPKSRSQSSGRTRSMSTTAWSAAGGSLGPTAPMSERSRIGLCSAP